MSDPTNEPDLVDPTNARLRDFDIPIILPSYNLIEPPAFAGFVTTATCPPLCTRPTSPAGPDARGNRRDAQLFRSSLHR